jgi:cardiolipin synthase A/B
MDSNRRCGDSGCYPLLPILVERGLFRAGGARLVSGNDARILKDAAEHFPAFLAAIGSARRTVLLENYIFADDAVGREIAGSLVERARAGVRVHVICDWLGSFRLRKAFWKPLVEAGGEVRWFNPPRITSALPPLARDHRKMLAVDGSIAFVTGLCISSRWLGDPARGIEPWRDTGVEVRGPAVADIERAFAQAWDATGAELPAAALTPVEQMDEVGDVAMRVLPTVPALARLYRLDQLIAVMAQESLWLTDAYFVGIPPYVQALRSAALDGVDVRLLVPGSSDLQFLSALSRSGYRPLLEAGIRVFEWNGSMLHAKTAVADGRWARIGSSNLNVASWLGNYELDIAVEDARFAGAMKDMYESDLANATEIVLDARSRVRSTTARPPRGAGRAGGSMSRAAAGALRLGANVGAAIGATRVLGTAEAGFMAKTGVVIVALSVAGIFWPLVLAVPLVVLGLWVGLALILRARGLRPAGRRLHERTTTT